MCVYTRSGIRYHLAGLNLGFFIHSSAEVTVEATNKITKVLMLFVRFRQKTVVHYKNQRLFSCVCELEMRAHDISI